MPSYIYSKWLDSPAGCPIEFYCELDALRYEVRKVEVFANGIIGFASEAAATQGTQLGIAPVPSLAELYSLTEFETKEISQEVFEAKWLEVTISLSKTIKVNP